MYIYIHIYINIYSLNILPPKEDAGDDGSSRRQTEIPKMYLSSQSSSELHVYDAPLYVFVYM